MSVSNDSDFCYPSSDDHRTIVFLGGGRWGSILFEELFKQASPTSKLIWVTRDAEKKKEEWFGKPIHGNVEIIDSWQDRLVESDGAIIATSVDRHYSLARELLSASVPVLCEKPIAATLDQLDHLWHLASEKQCPFGIHLEFAFLTSFDDFVEKSKAIEIKRIRIEWCDPEIEIRGGIEKRAEYQCDIISDQLPHVWSLISRTVSSGIETRFDSVSYSPKETVITAVMGDVSVEIQLSRRNDSRRRFICFNDGDATFDFSKEPPFATLRNTPLDLKLSAKRPLQYTVSSFLSQVDTYKIGKSGLDSHHLSLEANQQQILHTPLWALSVGNYYSLLVQCLQLSERVRAIQDNLILKLLSSRGSLLKVDDSLSMEDVQLILDRWLPTGIAAGAVYRPGQQALDRELAIQIVRSRYVRA